MDNDRKLSQEDIVEELSRRAYYGIGTAGMGDSEELYCRLDPEHTSEVDEILRDSEKYSITNIC